MQAMVIAASVIIRSSTVNGASLRMRSVKRVVSGDCLYTCGWIQFRQPLNSGSLSTGLDSRLRGNDG
jgi:hypothetical protein